MLEQTPVRPAFLLHAGGNFGPAMGETAELLANAQRAIFVPYALHDYDACTAGMQSAFRAIGVDLVGLHSIRNPRAAVKDADAIVVGGGNTFRLAKALHELGLVEAIRRAVQDGTRYWGVSAGSNVAGPTIRTTNDMPIVESPSLQALGLVSFQINPHYVDADGSGEGETREFRINEFLEENDVTVVGLREGSWLVGHGRDLTLGGEAGAVIFRRGELPRPLQPRTDVSFLLSSPSHFDTPLNRSVAV